MRGGARAAAAGGGGVPGRGDALSALAAARPGAVRQGQHLPGRRRLAQRGRGLRRRWPGARPTSIWRPRRRSAAPWPCTWTATREAAVALLRELTPRRRGTEVAARAQFLLGDVLAATGQHAGRDRRAERTAGHLLRPRRGGQRAVPHRAQLRRARADRRRDHRLPGGGHRPPAVAAGAGGGLPGRLRPAAGGPRRTRPRTTSSWCSTATRKRDDGDGTIVFAEPAHRELVDAALCMLEVAWQRTGDAGRLSGAAHALLHRLPPSRSPWRAWALLIDADAQAGQGLYAEARASLERAAGRVPRPPGAAGGRPAAGLDLGAGRRPGAGRGRQPGRAGARHRRRRPRAVQPGAAEHRPRAVQPGPPRRGAAGVRGIPAAQPAARRPAAGAVPGRAVLPAPGPRRRRGRPLGSGRGAGPGSALAEQAWTRAGDVYFQAERYDDARRCYRGLLDHFGAGDGAALGQLRLAQCDYNAGRDQDAVTGFGRSSRSTRARRCAPTPSTASSRRSTGWARRRRRGAAGRPGRAPSRQPVRGRRAVPHRQPALREPRIREGGRRVPPGRQPLAGLFGGRPRAVPDGRVVRRGRPRRVGTPGLRAVPGLLRPERTEGVGAVPAGHEPLRSRRLPRRGEGLR